MTTIAAIRAANRDAGLYFFEPDTLRFFRSRILSTVYQGPGGVFFLTSEQFVGPDGREGPRAYTVRQAHADGSVHTAKGCPFNVWSRAKATAFARKVAAGPVEATP